eukprot:TRINITY_DN34826_c0_g1_i1.p1 TRINITY_DN34826_c0_g1~~TRINITY_DN34826_c0_g1_i1.p1  ORF type:complete len:382 (-),score=40.51 TRINITY_DN34826_c0_g1_i1:46-1191(-)
MHSVTVGILFMVLAGFGSTGQLVVSKAMQSAGLPYYQLLSMSSAISCGIFAVLAGLCQAPLPDRKSLKWVLMRGIASAGMLGSMIAAVQLGAPTGDVAAVSSVNTVFAALLGRAFLGEPLQLSHIVAVLCCIGGGVLISKPEILFGSSVGGVPAVAYLMAVSSGFWQAMIAISARKASKTSPWFLNICATVVGAVGFGVLPFTPLTDEPALSVLVQRNLDLGALGVVGNTIMFVVVIGASTLAAIMCPAAITATVSVSSRITSGYVADVLIFGVSLDILSCCGAALMLTAVLVMASARKPSQETPPESPPESPEAGQQSSAAAAADDETDSLASFIATEFVAEKGYQESVRHRRPTVASDSPVARPPTLFGVSAMGPPAPG